MSRDRSTLIGCPSPPAEVYDLVLLDLDGVVYVGPHPVPGAVRAIEKVRGAGVRIAYVTNNASRPPHVVADHLRSLGIPAQDDDVVTSAQAAASLLAERLPPRARVLVVGGAGLQEALRERDLQPVSSMDDDPSAVVQGFSPDVGWRLLAEGTRAVRAGLPWIASNVDLTVPTEHGPAPGNGALVAAVATASGKSPDVAGKPRPPLFLEAQRRYGSARPLVVGDRLDTDLEGARAAGMDGLLVFTGITRVGELLEAGPHERPHLVARDLTGLLEPHPAPQPLGDGRFRCRDAVVSASPQESGADDARPAAALLRLAVRDPGSDALDLLRAACAAAWQAADEAPGTPAGRTSSSDDALPTPEVDGREVVDAMVRVDGAGGWGG